MSASVLNKQIDEWTEEKNVNKLAKNEQKKSRRTTCCSAVLLIVVIIIIKRMDSQKPQESNSSIVRLVVMVLCTLGFHPKKLYKHQWYDMTKKRKTETKPNRGNDNEFLEWETLISVNFNHKFLFIFLFLRNVSVSLLWVLFVTFFFLSLTHLTIEWSVYLQCPTSFNKKGEYV